MNNIINYHYRIEYRNNKHIKLFNHFKNNYKNHDKKYLIYSINIICN